MTRAWCRCLVGLLVVAAAAAVELYDDLPVSDDEAYQNDNDIDTGPPLLEKRLSTQQLNQDFMLYRILRAMQMDAQSSSQYSSNRIPEEAGHQRSLETLTKGSVFKRLTGYASGPSSKGYGTRPQQRWKIKKGKAVGSQMVCYFKLCAFRSPS